VLVRSPAGELGDCVLIDSTNPLEYHPGGPPRNHAFKLLEA